MQTHASGRFTGSHKNCTGVRVLELPPRKRDANAPAPRFGQVGPNSLETRRVFLSGLGAEASARTWWLRQPGECHGACTRNCGRSARPCARSKDAVEAQVEELCKLCWASALEVPSLLAGRDVGWCRIRSCWRRWIATRCSSLPEQRRVLVSRVLADLACRCTACK